MAYLQALPSTASALVRHHVPLRPDALAAMQASLMTFMGPTLWMAPQTATCRTRTGMARSWLAWWALWATMGLVSLGSIRSAWSYDAARSV